VLLTASGFATNVKLLGTVEADPETGQVSIIFASLPQAPLQQFDLHVFGSERGLLATPYHCGAYEVEAEFVPWNTALNTRLIKSTITIDSGPYGSPCPEGPRQFAPRLAAGVANNTAGQHSPFSFTLNRDDGEQVMTGLSVTTPPGFAASLKGIPYCPEAALAKLSAPGYTGSSEQASPACPAASQIGTAYAGSGAGTHPIYTPGKVYLAGPYRGAPLSLVTVFPALAGPYDLGNVAVRSAIRVNPVTAQVTTVSDPLPQIVEGIPLRTRMILVQLDRPNFTLNPTNCDQLSVDESTSGDEGGQSSRSVHFQVANCADLDFAPRLSLRLRGSTKRRGHPAIRAVLRSEPGEANLRRASVTLPKSGLLDNAHIGTICTRVDFAKEACPDGSRIGNATANTRILDEPLVGSVYLRASDNKLPDMAVDLKGQIDAEVVGRIDSVRGRLRATFENVPDVPIDSFVLNLEGGGKGLLINSRNLCKTRRVAMVQMSGQNGVRLDRGVKLQTACGNRGKGSRRGSRLFRARVVR
jgi:hypothetical protein